MSRAWIVWMAMTVACGASEPSSASSPSPTAPAAQPNGGAPSCDARDVLCDALPPTCGEGELPSIIGSCWGPCVRATTCACTDAAECPHLLGYSETCYHGHCGPYL